MKRIPVLLIALFLVMVLVVLAGCGGEKAEEAQEQEDKITVEETGEGGQGGKVTVEGDSGETTYEIGGEKVPTEEELGAPIYPGAEYVPGSGVPAKVSTGTGEITIIGAEFTTTKAVGTVIDWYINELGLKSMINKTDFGATWMFQNEAGEITTVSLKSDGNTVKITIGKVAGDLEQNQ